MEVQQWHSGAWTTLVRGLTRRNDGWWWSDSLPQASFRWETVQGRLYFISRSATGSGHYRITMPMGQRLAPSSTPLPAAWQARVGTRWQPINESPDSVSWLLGDNIITLETLPDLPGYVLWDGKQLLRPEGGGRARMAVQIPVNHGRDLVELEARTINGQEELRYGSVIYRPAA